MQLIHDGLILTYDVIEFLEFVCTYVDCLNVCQACLSASISREPRVSYNTKILYACHMRPRLLRVCAARPAARRYRSIAARPTIISSSRGAARRAAANALSATLSADVGSRSQTCRDCQLLRFCAFLPLCLSICRVTQKVMNIFL